MNTQTQMCPTPNVASPCILVWLSPQRAKSRHQLYLSLCAFVLLVVVVVVAWVHADNEQMAWKHMHAPCHPSGQFCRWSEKCSLTRKKCIWHQSGKQHGQTWKKNTAMWLKASSRDPAFVCWSTKAKVSMLDKERGNRKGKKHSMRNTQTQILQNYPKIHDTGKHKQIYRYWL